MLFSYFLSEILLRIVTLFTTEELGIQGFALPLSKLLNLAILFIDGKQVLHYTKLIFLPILIENILYSVLRYLTCAIQPHAVI